MNKKIIYIFLLLFVTLFLKGQLSLSVVYLNFNLKYPSFNNFADSYNMYNNSLIKNGIQPFPKANGYHADISFTYIFMTLDFGYNRLWTSTTTNFNDNNLRRFDFFYRFVDFTIGFGYSINNFGAFLMGGWCFGNTSLTTYYEYPDGSEDIGLSRQLNGVYEGSVTMQAIYGIKVTIPVTRNLNIFCRYERMAKAMDDDLTDMHPGRMLGENTSFINIPQDYAGYWAAGGQSYNYEGEYVKNDFKGWRLLIGIRINFTEPYEF